MPARCTAVTAGGLGPPLGRRRWVWSLPHSALPLSVDLPSLSSGDPAPVYGAVCVMRQGVRPPGRLLLPVPIAAVCIGAGSHSVLCPPEGSGIYSTLCLSGLWSLGIALQITLSKQWFTSLLLPFRRSVERVSHAIGCLSLPTIVRFVF